MNKDVIDIYNAMNSRTQSNASEDTKKVARELEAINSVSQSDIIYRAFQKEESYGKI